MLRSLVEINTHINFVRFDVADRPWCVAFDGIKFVTGCSFYWSCRLHPLLHSARLSRQYICRYFTYDIICSVYADNASHDVLGSTIELAYCHLDLTYFSRQTNVWLGVPSTRICKRFFSPAHFWWRRYHCNFVYRFLFWPKIGMVVDFWGPHAGPESVHKWFFLQISVISTGGKLREFILSQGARVCFICILTMDNANETQMIRLDLEVMKPRTDQKFCRNLYANVSCSYDRVPQTN